MTGTFEGTGSLQFTPDNKFAYAYSGIVSVTGGSSANTELLGFKTESEYLVSTIQAYSDNRGSAQMYFEIKFNDVIVIETEFDAEGSVNAIIDGTARLIIPPFTNVTILGGFESGATYNYTVTLSAKVKGAIEQENLESISDNNKWAAL